MRVILFVYGVITYAIFFVTFLYTIGFLTELAVPKAINDGVETPFLTAILINVGILGLFGIQHSVMARPGFKKKFTAIVPEPIERSTYVLLSSLILILLFWQWRPFTEPIWDITGIPSAYYGLTGLCLVGFLIVLYTTFLIDHFDLFGLRQVYLHLRNQEYTPVPFVMPMVYKWVRNPLMFGFLIAFWATPYMTQGHLLFSVVTTAYIIVGTTIEERDHSTFLGEEYDRYKAETSMFIPRPPKS